MANVKKKGKKRDVNKAAYLFILPFAVFNLYPVLRTLFLSFTSYKGFGTATFAGLTNYSRVVHDKFFWRALGNTVYIWGINIVLQMGIAFILTVVFSDIKYRLRGLGVFRAVFYLPNIIAVTSVSFLFRTLLDWRYGSFNQLLAIFGINEGNPTNWLGSTATAPLVVAVIGAWMWFGNTFIMLMAGVQGIPKDYFEAAAIDGAGRGVVFRDITIPLIKPILLYVTITSLIGGLQIFELPFLISDPSGTAGNPSGSLQTVIMYMYKFGFETNQVGYASAIAYTLFFIILVCSGLQYVLIYKKED